MIRDEYYILSNGVKIPKVGYGTWQCSMEDAYNGCLWALEVGYRHIDTAYVYENEEAVGRAIKDSGIKREEIFLTTKLPADIKTYDGAIEYFNKSIEALKVSYVDLYLIHAPWPWSNVGADCTDGNISAWKALIDLYNKGLIKAIGVSNFHVNDIKAIYEATNFMPMVNQIRYFIGNTQEVISSYCMENNILIEAYSPLATGELLENSIVCEMAKRYNTTIAKICLRYCIEKGTLPLPKSTHKERIKDNLDIDFTISASDMDYLDSLYHIVSTRKLRD